MKVNVFEPPTPARAAAWIPLQGRRPIDPASSGMTP